MNAFNNYVELDELIALILAYMEEHGMLDELIGKYNNEKE